MLIVIRIFFLEFSLAIFIASTHFSGAKNGWISADVEAPTAWEFPGSVFWQTMLGLSLSWQLCLICTTAGSHFICDCIPKQPFGESLSGHAGSEAFVSPLGFLRTGWDLTVSPRFGLLQASNTWQMLAWPHPNMPSGFLCNFVFLQCNQSIYSMCVKLT